LQAAILVYGRALIEFYLGGKYATDISAQSHLGINVQAHKSLKFLKRVQPAMHVHLAHITEYRDRRHPERGKKPRPNWNSKIPTIVDHIVKLLEAAVGQKPAPKCHAALTQLLTSTLARRADSRYRWPRIRARG
jgi:hypothetical protein